MPLKADFSLAVSIHTKLMEYKIGILLFLSLEHFWCSNFTNIDRREHVRHYAWPWCVNWTIIKLQQIHSRLTQTRFEILEASNFISLSQRVVLSKASDFQLWRRKVVIFWLRLWERPRPLLSHLQFPRSTCESYKSSFTFEAKTILWVRNMFWLLSATLVGCRCCLEQPDDAGKVKSE